MLFSIRCHAPLVMLCQKQVSSPKKVVEKVCVVGHLYSMVRV